MASSAEFAHVGICPMRPIPETAFEGLREAVLVVDARPNSRAATAAVSLHMANGKFSLEVADDGIGTTDMERSVSGMGLKIMKYRASMIGAKLEIATQWPRGTVVRVTGEQSMPSTALQSSPAT